MVRLPDTHILRSVVFFLVNTNLTHLLKLVNFINCTHMYYLFRKWHFHYKCVGKHSRSCWYYKLKRCSNKECCKQCRYVMYKGTVTKRPVQKLTQRTTQNSYNIMTQQTFRQTIFLCFSDFSFFIFFFIDNFLNEFSKKCWCLSNLVFAIVLHIVMSVM